MERYIKYRLHTTGTSRRAILIMISWCVTADYGMVGKVQLLELGSGPITAVLIRVPLFRQRSISTLNVIKGCSWVKPEDIIGRLHQHGAAGRVQSSVTEVVQHESRYPLQGSLSSPTVTTAWQQCKQSSNEWAIIRMKVTISQTKCHIRVKFVQPIGYYM